MASTIQRPTSYPNVYPDFDLLVANCARLGIPVPKLAKVFNAADTGTANTGLETHGSRKDITFTYDRTKEIFQGYVAGNVLPTFHTDPNNLTADTMYFSALSCPNDMTVFTIATPRGTQATSRHVRLCGGGDSLGTFKKWGMGFNNWVTVNDYYPGFRVSIGGANYSATDTNQWAVGERVVGVGVRAGLEVMYYRGGLKMSTTVCPITAQDDANVHINVGGFSDLGTYNGEFDVELILIWDSALPDDIIRELSQNPYQLWSEEGAGIGALGITPHDPIINKTVTHSLLFQHTVGLPVAAESTISSSLTKIGLGGRMMTRIGSRIYAIAVDASKTYVVKSDDKGESWTQEQVVAWPAVAACIGQGASSQPVIGLVRAGVARIYPYQRTAAGGWTLGASVSTGNSTAVKGFQILYDNTSYHLLYAMRSTTDNSRNVYHRTSAALTSWAAATRLDDGDNAGTGAENDRAIAACLDSAGDIHLAYCQNKSNRFYLRYVKRTAGTWGSVEQIEDLGVDTSAQNRAIHLSLVTIGLVPYVFGVKWFTGVQQVCTWNRVGDVWTAEGRIAEQAANQSYPSAGVQNLDRPDCVFAGAFSDGTVHYIEKVSGSWVRESMSADAANSCPDQVYDPFRNNAITLEGVFVTCAGSIDLLVTTTLIWGDAAYGSGTATFSHNIHVLGRDGVTHTAGFSQVVYLSHAYNQSIASSMPFSQVIAFARTQPRTITKSLNLWQDVTVAKVPAGYPGSGNVDWFKSVSHSLNFVAGVSRAENSRIKTITHTLHFIPVGPGLTRYKTVTSDLEFLDDNILKAILHNGAESGIDFESVVTMNKSVNLTVTHNLAFAGTANRIRPWVWNSTHFDPGWSAEYEASVGVFIILGPDELPTIEMTLPKPDFDDENELFRREGSVRRNRTGQARTFVVPVYQKFKYQWSGFLRKRAEEFRHTVGPLLGKTIRITDHNGVTHRVKIIDTQLSASQKGPEFVNVGVTFEKVDAVYGT